MKARLTWVLAFNVLLVGLFTACDEQPAQPGPVVETAPLQPLPPEPYPESTVPPAEPEPIVERPQPPPAQPPAQPPAGDVYQPVDTGAPGETAAPAARRRPMPRESYAPAKPRAGQTYVIKKGDTLQKISRKFYGTTRKWRTIYEANRGTIKNYDKLSVGMKIVIPPN